MEFWLATTDHISDKVLFRKVSDFITAMNYVAVIKCITGVRILAFILMSNHVHFVFECTKEEARDFMNRFKTLYGRYFAKEYGISNLLRLNNVDIRPVFLEDESLKRAIAYVLMNSVYARLCVFANEYPWGSGGVYFNNIGINGIRIGSLSKRAQRRLLRSNIPLNQIWTIHGKGFVLPSSFISVQFVESLFKTPTSMKYFLDTSSKGKLKREPWDAAPSFSDQTIIAAAEDLKKSMFQKGRNERLSEDQLYEYVHQIRRRFNPDINQLCRTIGLSFETAIKIIDGI